MKYLCFIPLLAYCCWAVAKHRTMVPSITVRFELYATTFGDEASSSYYHSAMDVVVVESAVTPHDDAQSHAQSTIHQNVFDTMMTASSVRTGMIVVNKDTTILQLLQHCVERKVLNSVNSRKGRE
jgi:hypothetical protein